MDRLPLGCFTALYVVGCLVAFATLLVVLRVLGR